ncbi:hypothetical protein BH11PSE8_BH11PSE8_32870 [soil metagenome]
MTREERIRARAFELYLARGNATGSETEEWVAAEAQIAVAESKEHARFLSDTTGDAFDAGEEDPGAADDDPQVSQSLRAEATAKAPVPKTKLAQR